MVVAEITEGYCLGISSNGRHIVADVDRLSKEKIDISTPQIIAMLIFERMKVQSRIIIHKPATVLAILGINGEV